MGGIKGIFSTENILGYSTVFFTAITLSVAILLWRKGRSKSRYPPGPWGLPIVGYLPFLGKEPFRTLDNLSKKYGSIFSLYIGRTYVVILGDFEAVKAAFRKSETTDRPPGLFDVLIDGAGFGGASGNEWVEQRRFIMKMIRELVNTRSPWEQMVEEEVSEFVQLIQAYNGKPLNLKKSLASSVANNIAAFVFGKRFPLGHPDRKHLAQVGELFEICDQAGLYTHLPWLVKILSKLNIGGYAKSFNLAKDFNNFIRKEIESQKKQEGPTARSFVKCYLEEMEKQQKMNSDTTYNEINLIGNTQVLFVGGTDTSEVSITWLLLAMATYPDVQKKVHIELDSVLEEGERASWEDRSRLPYTYAAVLEVTRWKTIVPLSASRLVREDVSVGGFFIGKGSTITSNIWALHNDARYWKDPENFIPERFFQTGGEINFRPESYLTFSYGKRNCPGESIAMMEIFLYFTALMKMFEVRSPRKEGPCLDGILGLMYQPVQQKLCFIRRFP